MIVPFQVVDSLWQFSVIGACDRNTYHTQLFDKNLEFWFHNVYNLCAHILWFDSNSRPDTICSSLRNVFRVCVGVGVFFRIYVPRESRREGGECSLWWLFVCIHFKIEFVRVCDIFFPSPFIPFSIQQPEANALNRVEK